MKTCSKCNLVKTEADFNKKKKSKDGLSYQCRECSNKYTKIHYSNNKKYYFNKAILYKQKVKNWFREYKQNVKCELCGENHPATLDFHHKDKNTKFDCVGTIANLSSLTKLKNEIKKCSVLCSNCHRKKHYPEWVRNCTVFETESE